jgi:hypothetical protein
VTAGLDTHRIDLLLQFILLAASQADEWRDRELGPIHLLKYAYLADLAFARRERGASFTGAQWQFYHFGPWQAEIHNRIEPALVAIGADVKRVASRYETDFVRYSVARGSAEESRLDRIRAELPFNVVGAVERALREHGSDTASLLRETYLTRPMLRAAPGELLDLTPEEIPEPETAGITPPLSKRQQRLKSEAAQDLKTRVRERLRQRTRTSGASPEPRYDDVFVAGSDWLDSLAGEPLHPEKGEMIVDDSVWKSSHRTEPDVP